MGTTQRAAHRCAPGGDAEPVAKTGSRWTEVVTGPAAPHGIAPTGWRSWPVAPASVREGPSRHSTPVVRLARARPISAFFVLHLLSWVYWLLVLGVMGRDTLAWFVPGAFGPPLAALLVTWLVGGRDGTHAFLRRWVLCWLMHRSTPGRRSSRPVGARRWRSWRRSASSAWFWRWRHGGRWPIDRWTLRRHGPRSWRP